MKRISSKKSRSGEQGDHCSDWEYAGALIIVLTLALVPLKAPFDEEAVVIVSPPEYQQEKIEEIIDDVTYSDLPQVKVGANSVADSEMAEASAEMFAEVAEIPNPIDLE